MASGVSLIMNKAEALRRQLHNEYSPFFYVVYIALTSQLLRIICHKNQSVTCIRVCCVNLIIMVYICIIFSLYSEYRGEYK